MDYLTRYGPQGTFAEVAEIRLQQLTSAQAAKPAPAPAPRPAVRLDPPPPRRAEPPPRRLDPPPPPRRAEAPQRRPPPPPERDYDRDLHEPPRGQGGALRTFVLIALLGGAALAGGLYFGGGLNEGANAPPAVETSDNSTDAGPPPDAPADGLQPDGVNLSDAIDERPVQTAAREPTLPAAPAQRDPAPRESEGRDLNAAATPTYAAPNAGPISLSPGATPSTTSGGPVPLGPQPLAPQTSIAAASPQPAAATPPRPTPGAVVFTQRPTPRRIADLYPDAASRQNLGGRVQLNCVVQPNLSLACSVASESTPGVGFGRAALAAANAYRARATLSDGASSVGATTRIAVAFQAPE